MQKKGDGPCEATRKKGNGQLQGHFWEIRVEEVSGLMLTSDLSRKLPIDRVGWGDPSNSEGIRPERGLSIHPSVFCLVAMRG